MANTYVAIATVTVGSGGASTISFSSIPNTYTDLKVVLSGRVDTSGTLNAYLYCNGSTSNLSGIQVYGDGTSAFSGNGGTYGSKANLPGTSWTASTFGNAEWYIPNYTSSNYKSFSCDTVSENNATTAFANLWATLWSNTAAISSITLGLDNTGNFVQYSTATLYGIKNS